MDDPMRPHRLGRLLNTIAVLSLAGSAIAMPPAAALAASPTPLDNASVMAAGEVIELAPVAALLDDLGADDLAARELACRVLIESEVCSDAVIVKALRTFALLPEQRARLVDCLRARFFEGPQNAIGVQMQAMENGVLLTRVFPQFPAAKTLMAGDVVLSIDGVRLVQNAAFAERSSLMTRLILSHDRAEPLQMTLLRNDELIDVLVPLGSRRAFDDQNAVDDFTLQDAWRLRMDRLGVDDGSNATPIVAAVDPRSDWLRSRRVAMRLSSPDGLSAGGETSLEPQMLAPQVAVNRPAPQIRANVAPNRVVPIDPRGNALKGEEKAAMNANGEAAFANTPVLDKMKQDLELVQTELARPNLDPRRREELLQSKQTLERNIGALEGLRNIGRKADEGGDD